MNNPNQIDYTDLYRAYYARRRRWHSGISLWVAAILFEVIIVLIVGAIVFASIVAISRARVENIPMTGFPTIDSGIYPGPHVEWVYPSNPPEKADLFEGVTQNEYEKIVKAMADKGDKELIMKKELILDDEDICGLCGDPGADKFAHPCHWPGEQIPDGPLVHAECEAEECRRAHAALSDEERRAFLGTIR